MAHAGIYHVVSSQMFPQFAEIIEYCEGETFQARCEENEVIVMTQARYGRMRLGRCVNMDYGK